MASSSKKKPSALNAGDVRAYLTANPDFLQQHPDLLRHMLPPDRFEGDGVVDMQGFMVSRLQADLVRAQDTRAEIIDTVRANLSSQKQVHEAALAAISARDLEEFIEIVTDRLPALLQIDQVRLCVERTSREWPQGGRLKVLDKGEVDRLLGPDRGLVLRAEADVGTNMFDTPIASEAFVRLSLTGTVPPAMLVLGSLTPGHFQPGQGTELLHFLTRVLDACLKRWLDLPPS